MSKNRTVYTVAVAGELVRTDEGEVFTRTEKAAAVAKAEKAAAATRDKDVTVQTGTGTVVHTVPAEAGAPVETTVARPHFSPWTRVDDATFVEALDVPAGYVVAYVRRRINAAAARHEGREGWKILQLNADGTTTVYDAVNTKEGQEIFNELRARQLKAREDAAAEAAAAKAEEVVAAE